MVCIASSSSIRPRYIMRGESVSVRCKTPHVNPTRIESVRDRYTHTLSLSMCRSVYIYVYIQSDVREYQREMIQVILSWSRVA